MKKILIISTIILTTTLLISGMVYPDFPLMWIASTAVGYSYIRIALIIILGVLLFSNPPRAMYFRYFLILCAAALIIATVELLMNYHMDIVDAIVFTEIAIIFTIEGLETGETNYYIMQTRRLSKTLHN